MNASISVICLEKTVKVTTQGRNKMTTLASLN